MVKNYLISAWRNLLKHKVFTIINIFSLTVGIASCLVIFLFIKDELSFDSFHKKNIYRLCEIQSFPGTNTQNVALSMPGMAPTMASEFPEIENYTRYWSWGEQLIEYGDRKIMAEKVVGVDTSFFEVFDFPFVEGDPSNVVDKPLDAVISEGFAQKLYGTKNVIGETFVIDGDQCIVRGVMKDIPENSHLQFEVALSIWTEASKRDNFDGEFGSNFLITYFILNPQADLQKMYSQFPDYMVRMADGDETVLDMYKLFLQPLSDVHLASTDIEHDYQNYRKFNGEYINVFVLVGIFILIIATVNFMNLTTARAGYRAKEVGVRKTIGARKKQLIIQFILESIFLSFLAFMLAVSLVYLSLPFLNDLIDRKLDMNWISMDPFMVTLLLVFTVLLGIVAGFYPSIYLSSFKPIVVLKGLKITEKKSILRSSLIVMQFSLAVGMIVCTLIVLQQLLFMKNKDLGFNKDHIVLIDMNKEARENYDAMKQDLLSSANVLGVTASGQRLGNNFHQWGFKVRKDTGIVDITPSNVLVDYDYFDVYDIKILKGRGFSKEYGTDDGLAFVINESFAKELGFEDPIGQKAGHGWYPDDSLGTIIGVTEDFNFNSLHYKVNTLSMVVHSEWGYSEMSVKLNGQNIDQALRDVEASYSKFVKDYPIDIVFLDDHFNELYKSDQQMGSVVTIMAALSILIGCMGLFGLASISIQRRIKEIGIRKVMGATVKELLFLLSRDFTLLVILAFIIASPLTYLFLSGWLENFAYRIVIDPMIFVGGGLLSMAIALVTISYHVFRAANSNPVDSLRYE